MDRDYILNRLVPYSLGAVSALALALKYRMAWDAPRRMEIYFDGKLSIEGNSNAFINPAIEAGLIHCRALLEFLGLCVQGSHLQNVKLPRRRQDDVGIESFSNSSGPLGLVTPTVAISHYSGPALQAESALLAVFHAANKGFAHFTDGFDASLVDGDAMEVASRGVPSLVISHLYTPLGLPAPDFEIKGRPRSGC
ncbi:MULTISPECIES: hypothetical protein [Rhodanobacter]|uniref:hypothetical protein n=1 Tax=Rhodanobacter TaxID=75309 RepID=UPI0012DC9F69|nr:MULTISPECIES: hypothetical protein [Rhodanobacter]UJM93785.1 hypothetical protein LRK32_17755 [Rhodanobacter denitrificans]UJM97316.1 hypothetical protein LRK44_17765 [Rhodanobacter denitrificans]UJN23269.1 hypothetical protein LRK54_08870 [Rhodanobacter denitrificans]